MSGYEGHILNIGVVFDALYFENEVGDNVMIVIGRDDNYESEDEEDREFISRWAKRKVSSRFSKEFLDGRKRFIFSWNKKRREIQEEALVHFFEKKGQKFEYQPKRKLLPRPATPPPAKAADPVEPSRLHSTLPERPSSRERVRSADTIVAGRNKAPHTGEQVIKAKEVPSSGAKRDMTKDFAILGCNAPYKSIEVVKRVFDTFYPALNISTETTLENVSPLEGKSYLMENPPRFCVLVVDVETVQDAYEYLPKRRAEFEDLLRTAADRVAKMVTIPITVAYPS